MTPVERPSRTTRRTLRSSATPNGAALITGALLVVATALAAAPPDGRLPPDFCHTNDDWIAAGGDPSGGGDGVADGCPFQGPCDDPVNRNAAIPGPGTPMKWIRMRIHIMCESDGSNPATTGDLADGQIVRLGMDLNPSRIGVQATWHYVNDSSARHPSTQEAIIAMKNAHSEDPATQLNVYVTEYSGATSTFPWGPQWGTAQSGIIIGGQFIGPLNHTITHECGHCFGLWHVHHLFEVTPLCGPCYEFANSTPDHADVSGDFCSDTPPRGIFSAICGADPLPDYCAGSGVFIDSLPQDYMSYASTTGVECWSLFTPQQMGRMHCWINNKLTGWLACAADINGDGKVDGQDIGSLFGTWGAVPLGSRADVNGDGVVDGADLAGLIGQWGSLQCE